MKQRQILAIGGRFYVDSWEPPILQRHLLSLSSARSPRICLLAGAIGDNPMAIEQFYREIGIHNCCPTHLNIYKPVTRDFADYFTAMDIIYVNGGSTRNLVTVWRDWGIDTALRSAWEQGVVMSGTSAGMNVGLRPASLTATRQKCSLSPASASFLVRPARITPSAPTAPPPFAG
jgi:peptidase E